MQLMIEYIKIPKQRKSILIGRNGAVKKDIENRTGTKIDIASDSCDIDIKGDKPDKVIKAREIVTAIGRGFEPRIAMRLLDKDCSFDMIRLRGETQNTVKRLMARVIGRGGSVKRKIEHQTRAKLCVYGKTVSFIGTYEENHAARALVEMILEGRPLPKVFGRMQDMKT